MQAGILNLEKLESKKDKKMILKKENLKKKRKKKKQGPIKVGKAEEEELSREVIVKICLESIDM